MMIPSRFLLSSVYQYVREDERTIASEAAQHRNIMPFLEMVCVHLETRRRAFIWFSEQADHYISRLSLKMNILRTLATDLRLSELLPKGVKCFRERNKTEEKPCLGGVVDKHSTSQRERSASFGWAVARNLSDSPAISM